MRALCDGTRTTIVEVTQRQPDAIDIRLSGSAAERHLQTVGAMVSADVDLHDWYRRVRAFQWLAARARDMRGARCQGIAFQQLSIVAAAAIMQPFVERFSTPITNREIWPYPLHRSRSIAAARESSRRQLRAVKASYLRAAGALRLSSFGASAGLIFFHRRSPGPRAT